jgi:hypothetical protein
MIVSRRSIFIVWTALIVTNALLIGVLCVVSELTDVLPSMLLEIYCVYWLALSSFFLLLVLTWRDLWQRRLTLHNTRIEFGETTLDMSSKAMANSVKAAMRGMEDSRALRMWFMLAQVTFVITFELCGFMARQGGDVFAEPLTASLYALMALIYWLTQLIAMDTASYPAGLDGIFGSEAGWRGSAAIAHNELDKQI